MVGADLANLVNEAALLAARNAHETVQMSDFTESLEKILLGAPRGVVLSAADRERTAFHESGHALVGMLTPEADPVRKVSIIPRGQALGVTLATPDGDRVSYSREELDARIRVALGGRVAEEIVYGKITTGAESDIQQLTQIARQMVGRWGMSEKVGPIAVLPSDEAGPGLPGASAPSAQTLWMVDQEVHRLIEDAHTEVTKLLAGHRNQLDGLAKALLKAETLDSADASCGSAHSARPGRSRGACGEPERQPVRSEGKSRVVKYTVSDLIIHTLKSAGVRRVYGIPGDSLNGFTDALFRDGTISWQHVRHEEAAAFAAAGEAAITGEVAVCAASCGPGNLHLVNGLYDAASVACPGRCHRCPHSDKGDRGVLLSRDASPGALSRMQCLL